VVVEPARLVRKEADLVLTDLHVGSPHDGLSNLVRVVACDRFLLNPY
jgi:hypothetical protein